MHTACSILRQQLLQKSCYCRPPRLPRLELSVGTLFLYPKLSASSNTPFSCPELWNHLHRWTLPAWWRSHQVPPRSRRCSTREDRRQCLLSHHLLSHKEPESRLRYATADSRRPPHSRLRILCDIATEMGSHWYRPHHHQERRQLYQTPRPCLPRRMPRECLTPCL